MSLVSLSAVGVTRDFARAARRNPPASNVGAPAPAEQALVGAQEAAGTGAHVAPAPDPGAGEVSGARVGGDVPGASSVGGDVPGGGSVGGASVGGDVPGASPVGQFGQLLVAQIPSEALLAYTTLLAVFSAGKGAYVPGRWVLYIVAVLLCPAVVVSTYLAKRDYGFKPAPAPAPAPAGAYPAPPPGAPHVPPPGPRAARPDHHLPIFPAVTGMVSMGIYGLTVPGCALQAQVSGPGFAVAAGCLAVGGGVVMSLFAPFLGRANSAEVDPATVPATP